MATSSSSSSNAEITEILMQTQSHDVQTRQLAEQKLERAKVANFSGYLLSLANEFAQEDQKPAEIRQLSGLILKNAIDSRSQQTKQKLQKKYAEEVSENDRNQIKTMIFSCLNSREHGIRHTAAQVIAKFAAAEIPLKQWPELIPRLQMNVSEQTSSIELKQATLETLGYVCEELAQTEGGIDSLDQKEVNFMLTAIIQGMDNSGLNNEVRLAACNALSIALTFASENFSKQEERDYIMQVTCEASVWPDQRIRFAAFEVLVGVAEEYYEHLESYISAIYDLTVRALQTDDPQIGLQAIEFWSSVCEEEIGRMEAINAGEKDVVYHQFIEKALGVLTPMLLEQLTKQEEGQDEDETAWNLAMAGGICLNLIANLTGDKVVDGVMQYITQNIQQENWRQKEAALFAFGAILEGPSREKLAPLANEALPFLLNSMKDKNTHVKDTTAWTIGRVFEFVQSPDYRLISENNLHQTLEALTNSLKDVPNVAGKACWSIQHLITSLEDDVAIRPMLAQAFQPIVQALLITAERSDAEMKLKMECYEALNEIIRCASSETLSTVHQLIPVVLQKLGSTFDAQVTSQDMLEKQTDQQALLCGTLQVIIQRLGSEEAAKGSLAQHSDNLMTAFLKVLANRSATVHEEAMLAVGALAHSVGKDFEKYMVAFYPFVKIGLENHEEFSVCQATVGVVGDICRALDERLAEHQWCDNLVYLLLQDLQSSDLHRSVKPPILSCFGDIALAVGPLFDKYLEFVLPMLQSATALALTNPDPNAELDEDTVNYKNELRNGIFEAYTGILQGFRDDSTKIAHLAQHARFILSFIEDVSRDPYRDSSVTKNMVALLGDMADTMDGIGALFKERNFYQVLFQELNQESSGDDNFHSTLQWAHERITEQLNR